MTGYQLKGTLGEYLRNVNETCEETFSRLVKQYAECESVTEQLKAENQMKWVGLMNNIRNRVEETYIKTMPLIPYLVKGNKKFRRHAPESAFILPSFNGI